MECAPMQERLHSDTLYPYSCKPRPCATATVTTPSSLDSMSSLTETSAINESPNSSLQVDGSNVMNPAPPSKSSATLSSSATTTVAHPCIDKLDDTSRNLIGVEESRHFWRIRSSLSHLELMFVDSMETVGVAEAVHYARLFGWETERPLQILQSFRCATILA